MPNTFDKWNYVFFRNGEFHPNAVSYRYLIRMCDGWKTITFCTAEHQSNNAIAPVSLERSHECSFEFMGYCIPLWPPIFLIKWALSSKNYKRRISPREKETVVPNLKVDIVHKKYPRSSINIQQMADCQSSPTMSFLRFHFYKIFIFVPLDPRKALYMKSYILEYFRYCHPVAYESYVTYYNWVII